MGQTGRQPSRCRSNQLAKDDVREIIDVERMGLHGV